MGDGRAAIRRLFFPRTANRTKVIKALGHLYFLVGLGAFAALALGVSLYRAVGRRYRLPYVVDSTLYSPGQLAFLAVLERALGRGYRVFGPVRALDAIDVRRRLDRRSRRRAWERLADRRFDFLICHAGTSAIACAVNLAPRSRIGRSKAPRDLLDDICAAAGLPLVRFRETQSHVYSVAEIEERVLAAIQAAGRGLPEDRPPEPESDADLEGFQGWGGAVIVAEDRRAARRLPLRGARSQPGKSGMPAPAPRPSPQAAPGPEPVRLESPRLEPSLAGAADIDLGPSFSIDGDLEDEEHPPRKRQRRR